MFEKYKTIVGRLGGNQLVERRVRDHLQSLGMQGFLIAETRNRGIRGGSHYQFELQTDLEATLEILAEDGRVENIIEDMIEIATAKKLV